MGRENEISRSEEPAPPQQGGVSYDQAMEGSAYDRVAQNGNFYDRKYNELPPQLGDQGAQMPPEGEQRMARTGGSHNADCDWRPNPASQSELTQAWKRASQERMGLPMQLDANGEYAVVFGDSLGAVAMRNLRTAGAPASSQDVKAEIARIAALNKDRYPSLDCNVDLIKEGWHLRVGPPGQGPVEPPPRERPPERPPERRPPERPPEQPPVGPEGPEGPPRRRGNTVNIYNIDADRVRINGGAEGGVPRGYDGPRAPEYGEPRPPVRYDEGPRYRPQERVGYDDSYTRIIIGGDRFGYERDPRYMIQDPRIGYRNPGAYRQDPWAYAAMDGQQWYRGYEYQQDPRLSAAMGGRYMDPRMMDPRYLDPRMDPRLAYRYGRGYQGYDQAGLYFNQGGHRRGRGGFSISLGF